MGTSLETTEISLTGTIQDNLDEISQLTIVGVTSAATINGVAPDSTAFEAQVNSRNAFFTFIVRPVRLDENGNTVFGGGSGKEPGADLAVGQDLQGGAVENGDKEPAFWDCARRGSGGLKENKLPGFAGDRV